MKVKCLGTVLIAAAKQRYFFDLWDGLFHASVIFDIVVTGSSLLSS
jgi:hypothetical protein